MGSPAAEHRRQDDEGPQRRVTLCTFALGKTPVTQGQWKALMGGNPGHFKRGGNDFPVEPVSWNDAQQYLRALSAKTGKDYRLPSEAQWEYAARAGTTTPYYTGQTITHEQACFSAESPVRVGSFAANPFGLQDMLGNVCEWVQDCYDRKAYAGAAPSDGSAFEKAGCAKRVLRGGYWGGYDTSDLRAANRIGVAPDDLRRQGFGFRVCRVSPIE